MMDSKRILTRKYRIISAIFGIIVGLAFLVFGLIFWNDLELSTLKIFYGIWIFIIIIGIFDLLRLSRANILKQNKELNTKQIKFYDEILKDDPNNVNVLIEKGTNLFILEHYQDAVECFNRALEIEPNNLEATAKKRFALEKLNNYNKAVN